MEETPQVHPENETPAVTPDVTSEVTSEVKPAKKGKKAQDAQTTESEATPSQLPVGFSVVRH